MKFHDDDMSQPEVRIEVLVPRDAETGRSFVDAMGASRQDVMTHFTRMGRHDLTLSQIFHLDLVPGLLFFGGKTAIRSDLLQVVVPVSLEGAPVLQCVSQSYEACERLLVLTGRNPAAHELRRAGLRAA